MDPYRAACHIDFLDCHILGFPPSFQRAIFLGRRRNPGIIGSIRVPLIDVFIVQQVLGLVDGRKGSYQAESRLDDDQMARLTFADAIDQPESLRNAFEGAFKLGHVFQDRGTDGLVILFGSVGFI